MFDIDIKKYAEKEEVILDYSAIYWLGRMIDGGEDPLYIARRLIRFASEDIGSADNNALNLAINTFQACKYIGLPECDLNLTQCVIYMSIVPKCKKVPHAEEAFGYEFENLC